MMLKVVTWLLLDCLRCAWITPVEGDRIRGQATHKHIYYLPFIYETRKGDGNRAYFDGGQIRIISVGKFIPRKNHIVLLKAMQNLRNVAPLKLTLIGEISCDEHKREVQKVKEFIESNKLGDIVNIKDNLPFLQVQKEYGRHDLLVTPSSSEPAEYSVLEAMAHGLPVLCSDSNGTKDYVRNGHSGYIFKSDCVSNLTDKLSVLVSNREKIKEFGRNGFELAKLNHSPQKYLTDLMTIIRERFD